MERKKRAKLAPAGVTRRAKTGVSILEHWNCHFASLHCSCNFIFSCKSLSPVGRVSVGCWMFFWSSLGCWILSVGYWIFFWSSLGCWILSVGYWIFFWSSLGCWILSVGCWMFFWSSLGCWILGVGYWIFISSFRSCQFEFGHK